MTVSNTVPCCRGGINHKKCIKEVLGAIVTDKMSTDSLAWGGLIDVVTWECLEGSLNFFQPPLLFSMVWSILVMRCTRCSPYDFYSSIQNSRFSIIWRAFCSVKNWQKQSTRIYIGMRRYHQWRWRKGRRCKSNRFAFSLQSFDRYRSFFLSVDMQLLLLTFLFAALGSVDQTWSFTLIPSTVAKVSRPPLTFISMSVENQPPTPKKENTWDRMTGPKLFKVSE